MFDDKELSDYEKDFKGLGITKTEEQKNLLNFFYTLGTIIYNTNV